MSIARHHAEWLSLVPVSGPFLSLPVLMEAFNAGLEPHDSELSRAVRQAYGQWQESFEKRKADPAPHHYWIKFVLNTVLELDEHLLAEGQAISQALQVEIPEHHELLRPSIVMTDPNTKKPRMLVQIYPRSQDLTSYVANSRWKASPDTRMTELLHATGVRLGILTNGEHWMLVDAPKGETTGYASWYAALWLEEPLTFRAFRSLLSASRFFNVPDDQTLESLLSKSSSNQQEVTDQLGYQVRRAVEVLILSLDRADQDFGRELLAGVSEEVLYESALTVMMRLVFLFCAEERELIPSKPFPVYEQNYSVSTISKQLRELADQHGEELLERRYDAWPRLLAAFRAVFGGLRHDDLYIPAYGGKLFNPDRFPFLEGRKPETTWRDAEASPLPVNNRTVLHLLEALQLLQIKVPGGGPAEARRLSFRALDIEQIGHVYEGLLDHTAKRAKEPFLGLAGTRDKEPEIPLAELEKLLAKGEADLCKFLKVETGKSESALKKRLKIELDVQDAARFRTSCQSDDELWKRVEPLAGLVRMDNFGYPVVIQGGSIFVTAGTDRRSSGTHYTPRILTEPIVQHTLEPLVYIGPAEGLPRGEWKLKSARELLELKICDMACGSGAFLVQACRYLAARLLEAWDELLRDQPGTLRMTPEGQPATGNPGEFLIPDDPDERLLRALRLVAQRCLYGVDINPLAVEMAKLSLWLLTMARDKPFEFLDHNIRCGDSLVGLHSLDQLRHYSLKPDADDAVLFKGPLDTAVDEAIALRSKLEDLPANTIEDIQRQETLLSEANEKMARLRCAADLLVSAEFWGENAKDKLERVRHAAVKSGHYIEHGPTEEFELIAAKERRGQKMFHWPLEFPEVMKKRGGFDAFVGNPPFLGGRRISYRLGAPYFAKLKGEVGESVATTDLCVYFLLRAFHLIGTEKCVGLVLSDVVSQGDSRENGLARAVSHGATIFHAVSTRHWPGEAGVKISHVHLRKGDWVGKCVLDEKCVARITTFLREKEGVMGDPEVLVASTGVCYTGHYLMGQGFVVTSDEAAHLISLRPSNAEVIFSYIRGDDINNEPSQATTNQAINFGMLELEEITRLYPECLERIRTLVKPERDEVNRAANRERWWRYAEARPGLHRAIKDLSEVVVQPFTAKFLNFSYVSSRSVFAHPLVVITDPSFGRFATLLSCFHEAWAREYCSTSLDLMRYTASRVFDTFPFPPFASLEYIGKRLRVCRDGLRTKGDQSLNGIYNQLHDCAKDTSEISSLRQLHVELDQAVSSAYGWTDLDLGHGFHETKQGVRFTISEPARREVLQRLLKLNHKRYAEEVAQGLHDKKKGAAKKATPKKRAASKPARQEASLFDGDQDE